MKTLIITASLLLTFVTLSNAQFVGTAVTGDLQFNNSASNNFAPVNGGVPPGYANSASGPTVTISDSTIEFGYMDPGATITADFTDSTLTLDVEANHTLDYNPEEFTFTDAAFSGQDFSNTSDTFSEGGLTFSQTGDQIKMTWGGGTANLSMQAVYSVDTTAEITVPEPSTWAMLLGGLGMLAFWRLRMQRTVF